VPEYRGYVLDAARERLADVMPPSAGADVSLQVAAGPAAETIGTYAADADLIVMGRSRRFMHLGSTAVRMLRTTDRALLIVPPEAAQAADEMVRRAA
jgi:nucleotide-binding universal stress UspA family protein